MLTEILPIVAVLMFAAFAAQAAAPDSPATRNAVTEKTGGGDLIVQPINHSAIRFEFKGKQYYVDPSGTMTLLTPLAEWTKMPKADAIFITHEHSDHLAPAVIKQIQTDKTVIFANASSVKSANLGAVIEVGEKKEVLDITVEAVPAYNISADRLQYHPKERKDNGYILTFADKRVYVAGDTEATPEMKALKNIDIAFLPCNLPYTMNATEAADAARSFKPKVLYPYHQGRTDPVDVRKALEDVKEIEVRVLALP